MKTTFIDRNNTNKEVFRLANERIKHNNGKKEIRNHRDFFKCSKLKRMARAITYNNTDIQNITFRNRDTLETWTQPNRTRGRPKHKWANTALEEMWTEVKKKNPELSLMEFDIRNNQVVTSIKEYANQLTKK